MKRFAIGLVCAVVLATSQAAASGRDCSSSDFSADDDLQAAVVRSDARRLHFTKNAAMLAVCPATGEPCREAAYLVPGNGVIVGAEVDGFRCAIYLASNGQSRAGWLASESLMLLPPAMRPDWSGRWVARSEQTITVKPDDDGGWLFEGDATYGALDPARVRSGGVNTGNFSATIQSGDVQGGRLIAFAEGRDTTLAYDQGEEGLCRVKLRLVGPWMVVNDNQKCGGHNVTFTGIYRRAR